MLGSGNITISGSSTDVQINGTSIVSSGTANIVTEGVYNASTNKIATNDDIKEVYSRQETLTNKIYVDSNGVEHPVYRKILDWNSSTIQDVTLYSQTYKGILHNIQNFSKLQNLSVYQSINNTQSANGSDSFIATSTHIVCLATGMDNYESEITIEYTKSS